MVRREYQWKYGGEYEVVEHRYFSLSSHSTEVHQSELAACLALENNLNQGHSLVQSRTSSWHLSESCFLKQVTSLPMNCWYQSSDAIIRVSTIDNSNALPIPLGGMRQALAEAALSIRYHN